MVTFANLSRITREVITAGGTLQSGSIFREVFYTGGGTTLVASVVREVLRSAASVPSAAYLEQVVREVVFESPARSPALLSGVYREILRSGPPNLRYSLTVREVVFPAPAVAPSSVGSWVSILWD